MVKINNKEYIKLEITDTGVGIKPENISKLFKMFASFNKDTINKNGIGLGLYVSKMLS